jgi:hypothetical protein
MYRFRVPVLQNKLVHSAGIQASTVVLGQPYHIRMSVNDDHSFNISLFVNLSAVTVGATVSVNMSPEKSLSNMAVSIIKSFKKNVKTD